ARVNLTDDSGLVAGTPAGVSASSGNPSWGCSGSGSNCRSGVADGSLLVSPSLPFLAWIETTLGTHCALKRGVVQRSPLGSDKPQCGERTLPMASTRRWMLAIFTVVFALIAGLLSGCGSSDPLGGGTISGDLKSITVGSADFTESKIIAELYAQALEA